MGEIIKGVDLLDILRFADKEKRKYERIVLTGIENVVGADSEEYKLIRKIVLDNFNNYHRGILKQIFGQDFEGNIR